MLGEQPSKEIVASALNHLCMLASGGLVKLQQHAQHATIHITLETSGAVART
jgi:hypothetical protein